MNEEKTCFVIAPIGEPDTDTRKKSDQVFKHIIYPAIKPLGYNPIRSDHISEPGLITSQVIEHVVESPLVIADLTGRNPNVFYELAIRHAIKKPLVQLIKRGEPIPFDVAGTRTIQFDINDLDSVDEAKREIASQIKSIERGESEIDTPISITLDLKDLRESKKPEERSLADLIESITDVKMRILAIEERLSSPASILPPDYLEYIFKRIYPRYPTPPETTSEIKDLSSYLRHLRLTLEDKTLGPEEIENLKHKMATTLYKLEKLLDQITS